MEYDVWRCSVNCRTTYKAVSTEGRSLDQIIAPENAEAHLDRLSASNKRAAIHEAVDRAHPRKKRAKK